MKLVLIVLLIFFLISAIKIEHPGVNNDQLMFVNAATLRPDNYFLWKSYRDFPLMVFPYIGALKSYIYMPIFYLFGVSIYTIRIPQIVLMALALFILFKTLKIFFNKKIAFFSILLLALDPSLIAHTRVDVGPVVLEFLLKVSALYLLILFLTKRKIIYFLTIFPLLALGLFNKLNFLWFINAYIISFLIIYWKDFFNNVKNYKIPLLNSYKKLNVIFPFILITVPYLVLLKYALKISREVSSNYKTFGSEISVTNIFNNLYKVLEHLISLINGEQLFRMIYGYNPTSFGFVFLLLVLMGIILSSAYLIFKKVNLGKSFYFFVLLSILILVQVLLTKRATNPWHAFSLYPFLTIIFTVLVVKLDEKLKLDKIFYAYISIIVIYQLFINVQYIKAYSQPTKLISYSSSIYDLADFTKNRPEHFYCLDADICNQIFSLNQQSYKYYEPFPLLDQDKYAESLNNYKQQFESPGLLYIAHSDTNSHFPEFKKSFFNYLNDNKIGSIKIKEFSDEEKMIFEVYKLEKTD